MYDTTPSTIRSTLLLTLLTCGLAVALTGCNQTTHLKRSEIHALAASVGRGDAVHDERGDEPGRRAAAARRIPVRDVASAPSSSGSNAMHANPATDPVTISLDDPTAPDSLKARLALVEPSPPEDALGNPAYRVGDWEFSLFGTGANDEDFEVGTAGGGATLGYYLGDVVQLSLRQNVSFADFGDSVWNGSTRLAIDFHIPLGPVRPFVGGNVGIVYGDTIDETGAAAPEAGVKVYVKEDVFLFAIGEYQFFFDDTDNIDDGFEDGNFVYSLGVGFNF